MELYHVTLRENLKGILKDGLRPSRCGLDGPGVYLWKGPLEYAVREADMSLSDNHSEMNQIEYKDFTRGLVMLAVTVPDDVDFAVEWPEYVVLDCGVIPAAQVSSLGSFDLLLEHCCPQQTVSELIVSATAKLVANGDYHAKQHEKLMD